jgi:hypothetical protein
VTGPLPGGLPVATRPNEPLSPTTVLLSLVAAERGRQDARWGEQNHPLGTGSPVFMRLAERLRANCDDAAEADEVTWAHIGLEEFFEALAEGYPAAFAVEAIQTCAVLIAAVESEIRRDPSLLATLLGSEPHP